MDATPFLRGLAFAGTPKVPYPRAKPEDASRLPMDTWHQAQIPAGVRLELAGDATEIEVAYRTATDRLGPRGDSAGVTFASWRTDGTKMGEVRAVMGEGTAHLPFGEVVHLPEGMRPEVLGIQGIGGSIEPGPERSRVVIYGDSVAEGWNASEPGLAWPAVVARTHAVDTVNLGYAGAARGEIVSAEHVAELAADVVVIAYGTNCWSRIPHSVGMVREGLQSFLDVVRQGHPAAPLLVTSPVIRPDAETLPNRLGASLGDLREVMEDVVATRIRGGDETLEILPGRDLIGPDLLDDGVHPNDAGHAALAEAIGARIAALFAARTG